MTLNQALHVESVVPTVHFGSVVPILASSGCTSCSGTSVEALFPTMWIS